ncbi:hypothetical protein ACQVUL_04665 [Bacillus cytotoxicus]|uniref:hypothetical protein n=1 Tax=Bacillus cytotoxicus TaxID=580165 RepID=UPI0015C520AA|nr:hypothetical protein [Bacillus cytotoxicus]MDH2892375.1 hypothetical protein [Bacillus cytotoxicus]
MLAGDDKWIKPDRMIVCFLEKALHRRVKIEEAQSILEKVTHIFMKKYPNITRIF